MYKGASCICTRLLFCDFMANRNNRRRKRQNREAESKVIKPLNINLGYIVFGIILVYLIFLIISYIKQEHITPYEVKNGSIAVNNIYTGVAFREEHLITTPYSGYINYYSRENEKISDGAMVYTVDSTGKLAEMVNENSEEGSTLGNEDLSELKTEISSFSTAFSPDNYKTTYDFKYNIEGTVMKLANSKVLANIDALRELNYTDTIDFDYAPISGVIVYSSDGYEDYLPENIPDEMMHPEEYTKDQFHSNELIAEGENAYKLITSEIWSILIEIDDQKEAALADDQYVEVRFLKNNYTSWAEVNILHQNGKIYAKLTFNNSMITFANERFIEIELLDSAREGLKIPKSSIVDLSFYLIPEEYLTQGANSDSSGFMRETYLEDGTISTEFVSATLYDLKDGNYYVDENTFSVGDYIIKSETGEKYAIRMQDTLTGVYNINKGYADFRVINVLEENDEYAIVEPNSTYGLSVYDHIVLKGETVQENDFIFE